MHQNSTFTFTHQLIIVNPNWKILEGGKVTRLVDGSDEQNSNWMRFVNCARDNKEQNLVAVQFRGEIYYKTFVPVEAGSELLVWFDDSVSCGSSTQKDQLGKLSIVALVGWIQSS